MTNNQIIADIQEKIKNDEIVILPTETIFGILGNATSLKAANKLNEIKQVQKKRSFITIFASKEQIKQYVDISEKDLNLLETFQDLSLTFIIDKLPETKIVSFNDKIAVRLISNQHSLLQSVVDVTGPLFSTSCNYEDEPFITEHFKILEFATDNNLFLVNTSSDDLTSEEQVPSTIIDVSKRPYKFKRIGKNYNQIIERLDNLGIEYVKR
ncbi:L-threonylcarbamoyladenylate synthase [Mycoplasma sp. SG1]|uniref:L-threonylcarbamoyladenylate synthase n=1 Tax=Mycoplasma sp. SG1 TaxID=2810348 RepID=UPI002024152E|nr:Sua5/YciO/YrdC/YwlC family protein [Mycoplasma sp. SG1]URM52965.1 Sua5/YciO/YrdC/YwlC family protein [Mycoplasma sp. SG1]